MRLSSLFRFHELSRSNPPSIHIPHSFLTFSYFYNAPFPDLNFIMESSGKLQIYAVCAGSTFIFVILRRFLFFLWTIYFKFWFYKYFYHTFALRRHRFIGPISWFSLIIVSVLWISAVALNFTNAPPTSQLGANLGEFALTLLVPLFFGGEFTLATRILEVSLRLLRQIHIRLGVLTLVSIVVHSILSGSKGVPFSLSNIVWLYGLIVSES